jgi:hypothetical protein
LTCARGGIILATMSFTKTLAEKHGFRPGDRVIVLTIERKDGSIQRNLYAYGTAAAWAEDGLERDGFKYTRSYEPWSGSESVSFYNGD